MTRTSKWTVHEAKSKPKYFTHNGNFGESPNHVKRGGYGKGNWGKPGDEINDLIDSGEIKTVFNKTRRGSNSQNNERRLSDLQQYHI
ncbi:Tma10p [Saccharomyces cerevisiae YJM1356]|nr:Tma10p [Saccharomyces cerevisiae YJM1078]AJV55337.1 Tma10p [Saccharomyces cerevisiae YJM1341]AJV56688.1 Tma10p [Saccharomyces cerevisiae YJM1356]AJV62086.1 Tma10p [Saccharomyces cerevisiae YJM1415]EWG84539.1 Tma10p [Saccharomyces cerevisiae R008]EWG89697.1 Tma10p [Saccharomyces cerevisiae P301]CAI4628200.1 BLD_1a_G0037840.mRNA.1.CDS.1 [Saccharomyces cerevisiae]